MSSPELDALLISNLSDLEAVRRQLAEVQHNVFRAVDADVETWATERGWSGVFDYLADALWLAPPTWRQPEGDAQDVFAWFVLSVGPDDTETERVDEDYLYLTRLCQAGFGQLGFTLGQSLMPREATWKRFLQSHTDLIEATPFILDRNARLFLPVRIDRQELANALREQSIPDALTPLRAALDQLAAAQPALDRLLEAAQATVAPR